MKIRRITILAASVLFLSATAQSAVSPDIPLGDATYHYLDLLTAHQVIPPMVLGQRPYTRMAVARAIREAPAPDTPWISQLLDWLCAEYRWELDLVADQSTTPWNFIPLGEAAPAVIGLDSPPRPIPTNNGLGSTSGTTAPLIANWADPTVRDGAQSIWETRHTTQLGNWLAAEIHPQFVALLAHDGSGQLTPTLQTAYGKIGGSRLEILAGRGEILWGPGNYGGPLVSANAPPLDMLRVATPEPFHLPGFLRGIGALKGGMFFATLGKGYDPPQTILSGYRLDIQPRPWIAIGVNHAVSLGGENMADPDPVEALLEFSGLSAAIHGPGHGRANSNHLLGLDLQVQIPQWRGLQLYAAYAYDDPDTNLNIQFNQDALWHVGVFAPRLTADGRWSLRGEYLRAGVGTYRHGLYRAGWTARGHSLGFPYGGNSNAGIVTVTRAFAPPALAALEMGMVQRSADEFTSVFEGGDRTAIVKTTDLPDELSGHLALHATFPIRRNIRFSARGGYEHVWNANFSATTRQNNLFAGCWLTFRFPPATRP